MNNLAGQHIKGYALQERIAAGGFGAVYRAHQSTLGREVAIKVILPSLANKPDFIRRFESEAQLIARLEHINIVPLHDYWRDPDGAYLVMRYMRGGSLHDHIRKQRGLSIEEAFNLLSQVAQGLHVAHRNQIVHRDIKPGNILLDEDGNSYLADFGIAKDHTISQNITEPDSFIGSPEYLAPEQARGEPVTPQTDIYSLGVVLYEMLAGEHPFPGLEKLAYIYKHLNDPLPDITTIDDGIHNAVNAVIQKATAKDPQQRFKDVLEMLQALRQAAQLDAAPTPTSLVELLTPREQEVMQLIIDGKTNREIAAVLVLAEGTVKQYITSIYRKLKVRSRVQAIARARDLDFVVKKPDTAVGVSTGHLPEPANPYKGLRAFQAADAQDFFGREKLIEKLLSRLQEHVEYQRFLAVVGPSGSGKSSVIKAGLIPALWRGDLPGSDNWYIVDLLPGQRPLDELEIALLRVAGDNTLNLRDQLERDERGLLRAANLILPDDGSELFIVIDQFEEVFTLVESEGQRLHLLNLLREAVTAGRSRVRVVVTLRADYYDRPLQYPDFGELMRSRVETVLPLSAEELERAINEPAKRVGVKFEDGLASRIVSDVHYQPGALPLLQYALTELFERRDGRRLTQEGYREIGGTGGALANRADEIYQEQDEAGREQIRQLFLRLVTLGEGAEDTGRRVERSELLDIAADRELMEEIIDLYAASRLLSLDNDPATRQPTIEVAHEAILREWERLRQWLTESRDDIRQERLIAQAADAWKANNHDTSYLLLGTRLEQAETWRDITRLALTPLENEYIQASAQTARAQELAEAERQAREAAQEHRSWLLLRALVVVFALAAVIAGGLALFALNSRNAEAEARRDAEAAKQEALRQASIGLAAQAVAELDSEAPERGVLLALEALENYPYTPQAERALAQTVYGYHRYTTLSSPDYWAVVFNVSFSPDGRRIATVGAEQIIGIWDAASGNLVSILNVPESEAHSDQFIWGVDWTSDSSALVTASTRLGVARVWDTVSGDLLLTYEGHADEVHSAYVSDDDRLVLTVSSDRTAHIWQLETGDTVQIFEGHEAAVTDAVWSPDNTQIVTASEDGTIRLWDANTGNEQMVIEAHAGGVLAVAWSPDGTMIASAGKDGLGRVWNVNAGVAVFAMIGHDDWVHDVEWSPDGTQLATASSDGTARVWDAIRGSEKFALPSGGVGITNLAWSPDGQQLVWAGGLSVRLWDASTPIVRLVGHDTDAKGDVVIGPTDWSPDSSVVLTMGDPDLTARIWNAQTGEELIQVEQDPDRNSMFGFMHPFQPLVTVPEPLRFWNYETGDIRSFTEDFSEDSVGQWSPDGQLLYLMSFGAPDYAVYDAETGERILSSTVSGCDFVPPGSWSPDNRYIAHGCLAEGSTPLVVTDAHTGEIMRELQGHTDGIMTPSWSPDGTRLAVGSPDKTVIVWDFQSSEILTVFTGHTDWVFNQSWSSDGSRVVSGDVSGSVRIWDAETGQEINSWNVGARITEVHWSPDGTRVVTTGQFPVPEIRPVWETTEDLIKYAYDCCVSRELTAEEREQFSLPEQ